MQRILIIGATSAIAESVARRYAADGATLYLLARNEERLSTLAGDLRVRGASTVAMATFEAACPEAFERLLHEAWDDSGPFDIAILAHGSYRDQKESERDGTIALRELQTNASSAIALLTVLANLMEKEGKGSIAVISSVAGDRGRPSNYVYGSAKAAVSAFCEGLRARLHKKGVHVLTIKPGMVDTPMTAGLELPALLVAKPDDVASDIVTAIERKVDVLYTPWYWRYVMWIIIHMPGKVFKKLNL